MPLADMVAAIKNELGLPEPLVGALPILGAANVMMGIEPEAGATLPAMAAVLMEQIGIAVTNNTPAAAAATPPPTDGDRRFKMEGEVVTSSTMRSTTTRRATSSSLTGSYGGDDVDSWVLLEALE